SPARVQYAARNNASGAGGKVITHSLSDPDSAVAVQAGSGRAVRRLSGDDRGQGDIVDVNNGTRTCRWSRLPVRLDRPLVDGLEFQGSRRWKLVVLGEVGRVRLRWRHAVLEQQ